MSLCQPLFSSFQREFSHSILLYTEKYELT